MSPIQDKFKRDVYSFLEEKKKVDYLVGHRTEFLPQSGEVKKMVVTMTFSSVRVNTTVLGELVARCDSSMREHTGNLLGFSLTEISKKKAPLPVGSILPLELTTMWEEFNTTKYIPKGGFFNHFVVTLRIKKL